MSFSPLPARADERDPAAVARASGSVTVLTLEDLARRMQALQPPAAYRLSLDSGVGYRNVRRAFERPLAVRLGTWLRLLRSLRVRMVAAACAEDVIWPGERTELVGFGGEAAALVAPASATSLRSCRTARGWSRRELAVRAGVSVEAVVSAEKGRGLLCTFARICEPLGLRLLLALPPWHASLEALWRERADRCLQQPAQYPVARPRRRRGS